MTSFGYFPKSPLDFVFGKYGDSNERSYEDSAFKFIQQIQMIHQVVQEHLEKN